MPGPWGGPVSSIKVDSADILYAGSSTGIYRKSPDSQRWENITHALPTARVISFDMNEMEHLFVVLKSDSFFSEGRAYRSTDKGVSWKSINSGVLAEHPIDRLKTGTEGKVWIHANNLTYFSEDNGDTWKQICTSCPGSIDLINSEGALFGYFFNQGIGKSTDNGTTWDISRSGLPELLNYFGVFDIVEIDTGDLFALTNEGIFKSADQGEHWVPSQEGILQGEFPTWTYAMLQDTEGNLLLSVRDSDQPLYRSFDRGNNWQPVAYAIETEAGLFSASTLLSQKNGSLIASNSLSVFQSTDNGNSWIEIKDGIHSLHVNSILIDHKDTIFAGTASQGIYRSDDFGQTWSSINEGLPELAITQLGLHESGVLFAGLQTEGLFQSNDGGNSWISVNDGITEGPGAQQIDAISVLKEAIYISTNNYTTVYKSINLGQSWERITEGLIPIDHVLEITKNQFIAKGGGGLIRSEDGGNSWIRINNGIGLSDVVSIQSDESGELFVATYRSGVFSSLNSGDDWSNMSFPSLPSQDPFLQGMALNSTGSIVVSTQDMMFMSTDRGDTWTPITEGLQERRMTQIAFDSQGHIYAAGENTGIMRTASPTITATDTPTPSLITSSDLHLSNFPNPFNRSTLISFELSQPSFVLLNLYDVKGQLIATLMNENKQAGTYELEFEAKNLPGGVYFCRLITEHQYQVRPIVIR